MAVKIPQDVTREDRLIGPLTLKQFLYVLMGSGVVFVAYEAYANYYLFFHEFVIIAIIAISIAAAMAFAQVNGQNFPTFLGHLYHFAFMPKRVIWHKDPRAEMPNLKITATDLKDTKSEAEEHKAGAATTSAIEHLATVLDTGGTIKAEQPEVSAPINNLNFVTPGSQFKDLDVEDILDGSD